MILPSFRAHFFAAPESFDFTRAATADLVFRGYRLKASLGMWRMGEIDGPTVNSAKRANGLPGFRMELLFHLGILQPGSWTLEKPAEDASYKPTKHTSQPNDRHHGAFSENLKSGRCRGRVFGNLIGGRKGSPGIYDCRLPDLIIIRRQPARPHRIKIFSTNLDQA